MLSQVPRVLPGPSEVSELPWQRRRGALLRWPEPSGPQWHLEAPRFMRFPSWAPESSGWVVWAGWAVLGRMGGLTRLGGPGQAGPGTQL